MGAAIIAAITFDVKFPKYDIIASCGYKNYCQKIIIDEDRTIFDELSTIQKFMHFFEFQADFEMSKWLWNGILERFSESYV